jgi:hypothetical protein
MVISMCRLSMYDSFLVLVGPTLASVIRYGDITSIETSRVFARASVLIRLRPGCLYRTVRLVAKVDGERIVYLIKRASPT